MGCALRPEWDGKTVICVASGPSLTVEDCELIRKTGYPVVVTNNVFQVCPWADALYAHDSKWWKLYATEVLEIFKGRKFGANQLALPYGAETTFGAEWFKPFYNSGACAVSLAISGRANTVIMLGYDVALGDAGETHFHGDHRKELSNAESMGKWRRQFDLLAKYARTKGVSVINASRKTSLSWFPVSKLEDVL